MCFTRLINLQFAVSTTPSIMLDSIVVSWSKCGILNASLWPISSQITIDATVSYVVRLFVSNSLKTMRCYVRFVRLIVIGIPRSHIIYYKNRT